MTAFGNESWTEFGARLERDISTEQARAVKHLRVARDLTWRGVAEEFSTEHPGGLYEPELAGNQIVGELLCEAAARRLGEEPSAAPWN